MINTDIQEPVGPVPVKQIELKCSKTNKYNHLTDCIFCFKKGHLTSTENGREKIKKVRIDSFFYSIEYFEIKKIYIEQVIIYNCNITFYYLICIYFLCRLLTAGKILKFKKEFNCFQTVLNTTPKKMIATRNIHQRKIFVVLCSVREKEMN